MRIGLHVPNFTWSDDQGQLGDTFDDMQGGVMTIKIGGLLVFAWVISKASRA